MKQSKLNYFLFFLWLIGLIAIISFIFRVETRRAQALRDEVAKKALDLSASISLPNTDSMFRSAVGDKKIMISEIKDIFGFSDVRVFQGSFTYPGEKEAVVSFADPNACHADGYFDIWLLEFDKVWKPVRKIADLEWLEKLKIVDVNGDNKFEIWCEDVGGNQGAFELWGILLSLSDEKTDTIFSYHGYDYSPSISCGQDYCKKAIDGHKVEFKDVDNDRQLEILDREDTKTFKRVGKDTDFNCVPIDSSSILFTYSYVNGGFKLVKKEVLGGNQGRIGLNATESFR